jgi:hypothetical protein
MAPMAVRSVVGAMTSVAMSMAAGLGCRHHEHHRSGEEEDRQGAHRVFQLVVVSVTSEAPA